MVKLVQKRERWHGLGTSQKEGLVCISAVTIFKKGNLKESISILSLGKVLQKHQRLKFLL